MTAVTLTDQMGAMSYVDALRSNGMAIQELLDLPKRRIEVAKRLREFYADKNIDVDEALIEQGVREYFDKRLVFGAPELSTIQKALATLAINRVTVTRRVAGTILSILVVLGIGYGASALIDNYKVIDAGEKASAATEANLRLAGWVAKTKADIQRIRDTLAAAPLESASRMVEAAEPGLKEVESFGGSLKFSVITAENADSEMNRIEGLRSEMLRLREVADGVTEKLSQVDRLNAAHAKFIQVVSDKTNTEALSTPQLKARKASALLALQRADNGPDGVPAAERSVHSLEDLASSMPLVKVQADRIASLKSDFDAMRLSSEDAAQVGSAYARARKAVESLSIDKAVDAADEMADLLEFAKADLVLDIANRENVRSGVERNFDATGNKAWYLIVEVTDRAGNPFEVSVASSETGVSEKSDLFGVRVSQEHYQRVRSEKKNTGLVRERRLGVKPSNSLSYKFIDGIEKKPNFITRW